MRVINKVISFVCILTLVFILLACEETEPLVENLNVQSEQIDKNVTLNHDLSNNDKGMNLQDITYFFKNPETGQEFDIVHAYLLYEEFFDAVKTKTEESSTELYKQIITERVYDVCFKDGEHYKYSVYEWVPEETEVDSIKMKIETMNKDHINNLFEESLLKSSNILSTDEKTTVCVFPENKGFPSGMMTVGKGKITVLFYIFDSEEDMNEIDNYRKSAMSHEYHHSIWTEKHHTGKHYFMTVLDSFVMEGQAVLFETLVYPELNSTDFLVDANFNKEYWSLVETYLKSSSSAQLLMGGSNGLPDNYGYSEGYKINKAYLELNPDMSVEEWTSKSPTEIFEESNYISNYK